MTSVFQNLIDEGLAEFKRLSDEVDLDDETSIEQSEVINSIRINNIEKVNVNGIIIFNVFVNVETESIRQYEEVDDFLDVLSYYVKGRSFHDNKKIKIVFKLDELIHKKLDSNW